MYFNVSFLYVENQISYSDDETINRNVENVDDESLEDSTNETVRENANILDDEILGGNSECVPKVGMKFTDENEVFEFYKRYAYHLGFPVRKRNLKNGDNGNLRYVTFTCSREG
ncbi:Protein FAR1-RELATED SEQUENCE [Abeliophyllum distichum]|uniref:Protein FAR1-RELATED SEQUENCE n=1 Tax=Abeliophyllum distichum TaxID=126358 RepID=A0ABD1SFF3_9LAMI